MENLELLAKALQYVEDHINEDICTDDIASSCYCSKSTVEKLFRHVNHISVRDYLIRRRMTLAGKELIANQDISVLEVALKYGYSTPESFGRAFSQVWNCNPSAFRKRERVAELFPKMTPPLVNASTSKEEDEYMTQRRRFDISELYDLFKSRKDCYFVVCDIKNLVPINEVSHKAGDLAILESMKRIEDAAGEDDIVFRIGGDEFVMLTDSTDLAYAEDKVNKILAHNGEAIDFEDKKIPLSLYAGAVKVKLDQIKYDQLFTELHIALRDVKID